MDELRDQMDLLGCDDDDWPGDEVCCFKHSGTGELWLPWCHCSLLGAGAGVPC